jgi:hypothetical protein
MHTSTAVRRREAAEVISALENFDGQVAGRVAPALLELPHQRKKADYLIRVCWSLQKRPRIIRNIAKARQCGILRGQGSDGLVEFITRARTCALCARTCVRIHILNLSRNKKQDNQQQDLLDYFDVILEFV